MRIKIDGWISEYKKYRRLRYGTVIRWLLTSRYFKWVSKKNLGGKFLKNENQCILLLPHWKFRSIGTLNWILIYNLFSIFTDAVFCNVFCFDIFLSYSCKLHLFTISENPTFKSTKVLVEISFSCQFANQYLI